MVQFHELLGDIEAQSTSAILIGSASELALVPPGRVMSHLSQIYLGLACENLANSFLSSSLDNPLPLS